MINQSVSAGVMSNETGTKKLEDEGFIPSAETEIERLTEEADADAKRNNLIGLTA